MILRIECILELLQCQIKILSLLYKCTYGRIINKNHYKSCSKILDIFNKYNQGVVANLDQHQNCTMYH